MKLVSPKTWRLFFIFTLIIVGSLMFTKQVFATSDIFYIAQSLAGSGDGSSCSNAKAVTFFNTAGNWANPKESGKIGPGDTVYLCGTITTTLTAQNSGSVGSPIVISGVDATSIIDGNITGIVLSNMSYITFGSNITIQNQTGVNSRAILIQGSANNLIIHDFTIDGGGTSNYGILLSTATAGNITIRDGILKKHTVSSLTFTNWTNASATLIIDNVTVGGSLADASFQGLTFNNLSGPIIQVSNVNISYSSTTTSYGALNIYQSNFGVGSYIDDSSFTYTQNASNLQMSGGSNLTFNRDNFDHAYGNLANADGSGAVVLSNATVSLHDITFNNCSASYNDNDGFNVSQAGSIAYNIYFNNNISHHNGRLSDVNRGDGFTVHGNPYNLYYNYNISYDNYLSGFALVDTSSGYVNNSISSRNGVSNHTRAGYYLSNTGTNTVTGKGWTIKNSIGFNNMPYEVYLSTAAIPITIFDDNIYKQNDSATNFALLNITAENFSTWQETYDSNSIIADPLFTDSDSNDYRLLFNSPAINTGTDVSLTSDYLGNPLVGLPDIGAYEFQAPIIPSSLAQYKSDGTTAITSGSFTNEDNVILKFNMSSLNTSDSFTPQVEIQPNGTSFTNSFTNSESAISYSGTPVLGIINITGLTSGITYHWQARISNSAGVSAWVAKGGNPDFQIDTDAPSTPTSSPVAGAYSGTQSVTLSAVESTSIRYSITETPADCTAGTLYSTPIEVSSSQTIYTRACDDLNNSSTISFAYIISPPHNNSGSYLPGVWAKMQQEIQQQTAPVLTISKGTYIFTKTLKLKSKNNEVKELQKFLNTHGYIIAKTGAGSLNHETNYFGALTLKAVKAFQKANKLTPDGIVGKLTRAKIKLY